MDNRNVRLSAFPINRLAFLDYRLNGLSKEPIYCIDDRFVVFDVVCDSPSSRGFTVEVFDYLKSDLCTISSGHQPLGDQYHQPEKS